MSRPGESRLSAWLVMAPALCLSIAGFGIPALYMARMSFNEHEPQTAFVPGFTFENYHRLLSDPLILTVIWNTARLALLASVATVALAYAFALLVWLRLGADGHVQRCHLRDPSWFQWPLLEAAIAGNIVADFPLCNKSFNCAYSGHDL